MKIEDIKIGSWYATDGDSTIKILDKLSDCFIVISYSENHHVFSIKDYPFELAGDISFEIDPEEWGFTLNNPEYDYKDKESQAYLSFDITKLSSKEVFKWTI